MRDASDTRPRRSAFGFSPRASSLACTFARRLVGDDAEDAVQDALLKAYRGFGRLQHAGAAPAWLTSILVNVCRDRGRAGRARRQEVSIDDVDEFSLYRTIADEDPYPYSDSLHLDFLEQFGAEDVRAVLARLPDLYRVPMLLVYVDGFATKRWPGWSTRRSEPCSRGCIAGASFGAGALGLRGDERAARGGGPGDHLRRGGPAALGVPRRRAGATPTGGDRGAPEFLPPVLRRGGVRRGARGFLGRQAAEEIPGDVRTAAGDPRRARARGMSR